MQNFMIALLVCSISMSLLAFIYMAITPFVSKRYSTKGCYYAWLVIVVGLIIPFRPQFANSFFTVDVPSGTTTPAISIGSDMGFIISDFPGDAVLPPQQTYPLTLLRFLPWWWYICPLSTKPLVIRYR